MGFVDAGVLRRGVVWVVGELGPHAAEDAVADAGEVGGWGWGVVGGGSEGAEDEFGRGQFGEVGEEEGLPGGGGAGGGGGVGGDGGHGAEEVSEASGGWGSYVGWVEAMLVDIVGKYMV